LGGERTNSGVPGQTSRLEVSKLGAWRPRATLGRQQCGGAIAPRRRAPSKRGILRTPYARPHILAQEAANAPHAGAAALPANDRYCRPHEALGAFFFGIVTARRTGPAQAWRDAVLDAAAVPAIDTAARYPRWLPPCSPQRVSGGPCLRPTDGIESPNARPGSPRGAPHWRPQHGRRAI